MGDTEVQIEEIDKDDQQQTSNWRRLFTWDQQAPVNDATLNVTVLRLWNDVGANSGQRHDREASNNWIQLIVIA